MQVTAYNIAMCGDQNLNSCHISDHTSHILTPAKKIRHNKPFIPAALDLYVTV